MQILCCVAKDVLCEYWSHFFQNGKEISDYKMFNVFFSFMTRAKKSNLYYTRCITRKRVTSAASPSPRLSAWTALSEETLQRWLVVCDTTSDSTRPGIKPKISRADSYVFEYCVNRPVAIAIKVFSYDFFRMLSL